MSTELDAILHEADPRPLPVLLLTSDKIHRGYVDDHGRAFVQERCNLDDAGVVATYGLSNDGSLSPASLVRCEHCFG